MSRSLKTDKWDEDDLAYVAGFIDGEGCFSVGRNWKITVSCANTHKPVVEWLAAHFGGSFCKNATRAKKPNHRRIYSWSVVSRDADHFCKAVVPYLRVKTEQALLLIALQQTMTNGGKRLPQFVVDERNRLSKMVKELKHVSWD